MENKKLYNSRFRKLCIGVLFSAAVLTVYGGESSTMVRVSRKGGITVDSMTVLAIGEVAGDQDEEFRRDLRKALKTDHDFNLLKREEQGEESMTDELYAPFVSRLAEKKQSLFVIRGKYEVGTDRRTKEENNREVVEKTVKGKFTFYITDLTNHTLSFARSLEKQTVATEEKKNGTLLDILGSVVLDDPQEVEVRGLVIQAFIDELYPHTEFYEVKFFLDDDLPELEAGTARAKADDWGQAIDLFKSVLVNHPGNENLHKAFFNLGLAYKWNNRFQEARENFERAYALKKSDNYRDEIEALLQFEKDYIARQNEQRKPVEQR
jgi:tetratricopeptide (TPR) repeat protein